MAWVTAAGCTAVDDGPVGGPPYSHDGRHLRDAGGGVLLLRGVNLSQTAKHPPFHPREIDDDGGIEALGIGGPVAIRYLTSWAAIEPERGVYSAVYLDELRERMRRLADAGHWVVLDLHQDVFGVGFGHNGAPRWACAESHYETFTRRHPWFLNYLSPEVTACFDSLFLDDDRLTAMAGALRRATNAALEGAGDALIGVDLLNEPWPGSIEPAVFDRERLGGYYRRAADALANVDRLLLFEPNVRRNLGEPTHLDVDPGGRGVYAPHYYPAGVELGHYDGNAARVAAELEELSEEAGRLRVPLIVGELGPPPGAEGAAEFVDDVYEVLDGAFIGAFYWDWSHGASDRALLDKDGAARPLARRALRPHARRVAGTPRLHRFDPQSGTLVLEWEDDGARGVTEVVLPPLWYPGEVSVSSSSGRWWREGALLRVEADRNQRRHRLEVRPR